MIVPAGNEAFLVCLTWFFTFQVIGSGKALSFASTIVIRYSAVRRQGYSDDGETELQILDYKQQQHRLFPLVAAAYCFFFTGRKIWDSLKRIEQKLLESKPVSKVSRNFLTAVSCLVLSFTNSVLKNT